MESCKQCGKEFESERGLHAHVKAHDLTIGQYYSKHFPRYDLLSKELIVFQDKEQYFSDSFNSFDNFIQWFRQTNDSEVKKFCAELLKSRKEKKGIYWAPTQVELRSLKFPSIITFKKLFGDYNSLFDSFGYKIRFSKEPSLETFKNNNVPRGTIFIDTREALPLDFTFPSKLQALKYGDYSFSEREWTANCYFERKSLTDFIGTMGKDIERFRAEVERSALGNANLIVIVEKTIFEVLDFKKSPEIPACVKVTPEFIFHNVRDIIQSYKNVQFLFVDGRQEASRVIEKIFKNGSNYKDVDLQLSYDLDLL